MMRQIGRLLLIALLFAPLVAVAGELGVTWDFVLHDPPPYTYTVLRDGVPWAGVAALLDPDPSATQPGPDGILGTADDVPRSSLLITDLPFPGDCVPRAYTLTASNSAGTSDPSISASSIPRPAGPNGSPTINVLLNNSGVHQIIGDYFPPDVQVTANGVSVAVGVVNRLSCQLVEIPTTPGLPNEVCVVNPLLPNSANCWTQPSPLPPTNVGFD